jgi:ankyrin repeat protein
MVPGGILVEMEDSVPAQSAGSAAVAAIHRGDVELLRRLLEAHPGLANQRIDGQRTLLHVATDWPGHFPNNGATAAVLIDHGAEVNAAFIGPHSETPLHWAASTNDVQVLDVLLDHSADIEAPGAVIGGGTPLADAVAFGQWDAARRLVERGAAMTLWQAAALGQIDRVEQLVAKDSQLAGPEITNAFWCACHGGQRRAAEYLLDRGANLNWIGYDGLTPLDAAARAGAESLVEWLRSRGARLARELRGDG